MPRCFEIMEELKKIAPLNLAESWDNVGLLVGNAEKKVKNVYLCLDVTSINADEAAEFGADMIISHHPLIFKPVKRVVEQDIHGRIIRTLLLNDISFYALHTNFDKAEGGLNDILAEKLNILSPRGYTEEECMNENDEKLDNFGRIGMLEYSVPFEDFITSVKSSLGCQAIRYVGNLEEYVQNIAVCSGGGADYMYSAFRAGADVLVTSDIKHHQAQMAQEIGLNLIDAGHFETENIICEFLHSFLSQKFHDINIKISTAEPFFKAI